MGVVDREIQGEFPEVVTRRQRDGVGQDVVRIVVSFVDAAGQRVGGVEKPIAREGRYKVKTEGIRHAVAGLVAGSQGFEPRIEVRFGEHIRVVLAHDAQGDPQGPLDEASLLDDFLVAAGE